MASRCRFASALNISAYRVISIILCFDIFRSIEPLQHVSSSLSLARRALSAVNSWLLEADQAGEHRGFMKNAGACRGLCARPRIRGASIPTRLAW